MVGTVPDIQTLGCGNLDLIVESMGEFLVGPHNTFYCSYLTYGDLKAQLLHLFYLIKTTKTYIRVTTFKTPGCLHPLEYQHREIRGI